MACYEFFPKVCSMDQAASSICWSSSGSTIIATVTGGDKCGYPWRLYLDLWESSQGEWVQLGYRNGVAYTYGDTVEFNAPTATQRTYRLRLLITSKTILGDSFTTPGFTHKG